MEASAGSHHCRSVSRCHGLTWRSSSGIEHSETSDPGSAAEPLWLRPVSVEGRLDTSATFADDWFYEIENIKMGMVKIEIAESSNRHILDFFLKPQNLGFSPQLINIRFTLRPVYWKKTLQNLLGMQIVYHPQYFMFGIEILRARRSRTFTEFGNRTLAAGYADFATNFTPRNFLSLARG